MAKHSGIHRCKNPDCWRQGKELVKYEVPVELVTKLKEEARKLGISHNQLFSMILEYQVRKEMGLREMIEKNVAEAFDKEIARIAPKLLSGLRGNTDKKRLPN